MVRKLLESYVEKDPELVLAASIPGANLAPELCRRQQVDLVLMDVQTENRENGLSAVTQISTAKSSEFTEAEMRVLRCLVQGMSYSATAETLGVDARTVKFHASNMLQKTNFENKLQLAVAAIENRPTANFPEE